MENFRQNIIHVIGSYGTAKESGEYEEKIKEKQEEMVALIAENAKTGSYTPEFDERYRFIAEEITALKEAQISPVFLICLLMRSNRLYDALQDHTLNGLHIFPLLKFSYSLLHFLNYCLTSSNCIAVFKLLTSCASSNVSLLSIVRIAV